MPTVKELKLEAKELKIKGYYSMKKNDLIDAIKTTKNKQRVSIKTNLNDELKTKLSKTKTKKIKKSETQWIGPLINMEVSGNSLKKKFYTLQSAMEAAKQYNKDKIVYDSILKFGNNHFQLRQAKKLDKILGRDLWLMKSEKDRILATKPTKRIIKIKTKTPDSIEAHKDWLGPIKNKRAIHVPRKYMYIRSFDEIDSLKNSSTYNTITKQSRRIRGKYRIGETSVSKKSNKLRIEDSLDGESVWYKKTIKDKI